MFLDIYMVCNPANGETLTIEARTTLNNVRKLNLDLCEDQDLQRTNKQNLKRRPIFQLAKINLRQGLGKLSEVKANG